MYGTHWARLDNGVCLPYTEQGDPDGPAVLLMHGYAGSRRFFEPMLPHLPAWMRVLAPDQRGHGDADKPPGGYAVADFAGDVAIPARVGDRHRRPRRPLERRYVAQRYAVDHPEQVAGLVLVGAHSPCAAADHRSPTRSSG